jgi:hypothetical protein
VRPLDSLMLHLGELECPVDVISWSKNSLLDFKDTPHHHHSYPCWNLWSIFNAARASDLSPPQVSTGMGAWVHATLRVVGYPTSLELWKCRQILNSKEPLSSWLHQPLVCWWLLPKGPRMIANMLITTWQNSCVLSTATSLILNCSLLCFHEIHLSSCCGLQMCEPSYWRSLQHNSTLSCWALPPFWVGFRVE